MAQLGIEITRKRLPELVAAAHQGITTVITKHGQPYAALVPVGRAGIKPGLPTSLLALKGSAVGLWGKVSSRTIAELRDEWSR